MKIAVFDIGTNSIHLLLAETHPDLSFEILRHQRDTTRLGDGSFETRMLSAKKMRQALKVIENFYKKAKKGRADETVAVATSAVRDAKNKAQFLRAVFKKTGIKVRVISGREEARLIFLGAMSYVDLKGKKALVLDVGGGSAELIVGDDKKISYAQSFKLGVARLTDHFIKNDPPCSHELAGLESFLKRRMTPAIKKIKRFKFSSLIGTSGTLFNLASMLHGKRCREFSITELEKLHERIKHMSQKERLKLPGLSRKRADLIVAGSLFVVTLMRMLSLKKMVLSERAIREGMILDFMVKSRHATFR